MNLLPFNVTRYKCTPEFTEITVPKGLLKDHKTKEGVWGRIVVVEGYLEYTILEPSLEVVELNPGKHGVVEPTVLHYINPLGKVRFYIEFLR